MPDILQVGIQLATDIRHLLKREMTDEERAAIADLLEIALAKHAQATLRNEKIHLKDQTEHLRTELKKTAGESAHPLIDTAIESFDAIVEIYVNASKIASDEWVAEVKRKAIIRAAATNLASTL
jgi:hypothetical protein